MAENAFVVWTESDEPWRMEEELISGMFSTRDCVKVVRWPDSVVVPFDFHSGLKGGRRKLGA